jgi:hypothetical protein
VLLERLAGENVEPDAADPGGGAGEVLVDELARKPDGFEDLRSAVGLDRRDAHLGDRLAQALADRLDHLGLRVGDRGVSRQHLALDELVDGLEEQDTG